MTAFVGIGVAVIVVALTTALGIAISTFLRSRRQ